MLLDLSDLKRTVDDIMEQYTPTYHTFNMDFLEGSQKYIEDNSVDLIITDPPFGIKAPRNESMYNRNSEFVSNGYIEVDQEVYAEFAQTTIEEAERILKPGGALYLISGYTNLVDFLVPLKQSKKLKEINHIIWKYSFGVYTKNKYVSSHYHILYYVKKGGKPTFNTYSRFDQDDRDSNGGSLNYQDREDVWVINKEYKRGEKKHLNSLPTKLIKKILDYSSNEGDLVVDFFSGSFVVGKVSDKCNRKFIGFEKSKEIYEEFSQL